MSVSQTNPALPAPGGRGRPAKLSDEARLPQQAGVAPEGSDAALLDLLRTQPALTVAKLGKSMQVTATAVRQRLTRLAGQGLVERVVVRKGRGRPGHHYSLTRKGLREIGNNFADLAMVLWEEIRAIPDLEVRKGLVGRIAVRLAQSYSAGMVGRSLDERLELLSGVFRERHLPCETLSASHLADSPPVNLACQDAVTSAEVPTNNPQANLGRQPDGLAVLRLHACPYPELAEQDRAVCAMERLMVSQVLGQSVRLSECRLDGDSCCTFAIAKD